MNPKSGYFNKGVIRNQKRGRRVFTGNRPVYGWLFALPWLIGLIVFYIYPLLSSIIFSFTSFNGINPGHFIGIRNYTDLITDDTFWVSVNNTCWFAAMSVPLSVICGVLLAVLLNLKVKGQGVYRVIFLIPTLVPIVAVSIIWQWLLNSQFGLVNYLLYKVGLPGPPWFGSEVWAKPSIVIIVIWSIGASVLTYLAGLQDIPDTYYEAAAIDGANAFQKFRNITLPLLSPIILYNTIMGIIAALQQFTLPFVISNGQGTPANSMMFYAMFLYKNAFTYFKMGMANAMAWIMFVVVMALTVFVFTASKKWIHYMGE
ncbi:MAG: carbohydrate ABC transporter permease [Bacillota bacterium]